MNFEIWMIFILNLTFPPILHFKVICHSVAWWHCVKLFLCVCVCGGGVVYLRNGSRKGHMVAGASALCICHSPDSLISTGAEGLCPGRSASATISQRQLRILLSSTCLLTCRLHFLLWLTFYTLRENASELQFP